MSGGSLFERIVSASGLTPVVAPYTIRRLLLRENVFPPEQVTTEQLEQALPNLLAGLRVYLARGEHEAAAQRLQALLRPSS
jgi:hypothetical protein